MEDTGGSICCTGDAWFNGGRTIMEFAFNNELIESLFRVDSLFRLSRISLTLFCGSKMDISVIVKLVDIMSLSSSNDHIFRRDFNVPDLSLRHRNWQAFGVLFWKWLAICFHPRPRWSLSDISSWSSSNDQLIILICLALCLLCWLLRWASLVFNVLIFSDRRTFRQ